MAGEGEDTLKQTNVISDAEASINLWLHQQIVGTDFYPPTYRKNATFYLIGKHLILPLTFSTKIQSNPIIYSPGILFPSVKYGLFLALGVMERVLTGPGENNQFTAKLGVQPMFMCNEGWLWKYGKSSLRSSCESGGVSGGFSSEKASIVGESCQGLTTSRSPTYSCGLIPDNLKNVSHGNHGRLDQD